MNYHTSNDKRIGFGLSSSKVNQVRMRGQNMHRLLLNVLIEFVEDSTMLGCPLENLIVQGFKLSHHILDRAQHTRIG